MIPPWLIIGAVVILVAALHLHDHREHQPAEGADNPPPRGEGGGPDPFLRGGRPDGDRAAAGAASSSRSSSWRRPEQPDIDYLIVTDTRGTILADSDPSADRLRLRPGSRPGEDRRIRERSPGARSRTAKGPTPSRSTGGSRRRETPSRGSPIRCSDAARPAGDGEHSRVSSSSSAWTWDRSRPPMRRTTAIRSGWPSFSSSSAARGSSRSSSPRDTARRGAPSRGSRPSPTAWWRTCRSASLPPTARGMLTAFNQTAEAILNRKAGEALGKPAEEILPGKLPGALPDARRGAADHRTGNRLHRCGGPDDPAGGDRDDAPTRRTAPFSAMSSSFGT